MTPKRSLYVSRPVVNAADIVAWAKAQGFAVTVPAEEMHVTIAFSRAKVGWDEVPAQTGELAVRTTGKRVVKPLGDKGTVVLQFESATLKGRWQEFRDAGASWDWPGYKPHITVTYEVADGFDVSKVEPYAGPIVFGPEVFAEVDEDWSDKITEKGMGEFRATSAQVLKVDESLGLVFGWAIVCKENGEDYYDVQDDHIPEDSMLKAASEFMEDSRIAKEMHTGEQVGNVVFAFPLTADIAKAMEITTKRTGLLIAIKPGADAVKKFADGSYTGFSIGGERITDEEIADAA